MTNSEGHSSVDMLVAKLVGGGSNILLPLYPEVPPGETANVMNQELDVAKGVLIVQRGYCRVLTTYLIDEVKRRIDPYCEPISNYESRGHDGTP